MHILYSSFCWLFEGPLWSLDFWMTKSLVRIADQGAQLRLTFDV